MLEVAEHDREIALREELVRQEKLEQLAAKFKRKADLRDSWMKETAQMLDSQADFGSDVASTQAAIKKEDTIDTEVHAFEERLATLGNLCTQLVGESYCKAADIQSRYDGTKQEWNHLTETMAARRKRLTEAYQLQKVGVYFEKKKINLVSVMATLTTAHPCVLLPLLPAPGACGHCGDREVCCGDDDDAGDGEQGARLGRGAAAA